MTKKDFLKLLEESEFFRGLGHEIQAKVMEAKGPKREEYVEMIKAGDEDLERSKQEFFAHAEAAVVEMKNDVRKSRHEYVTAMEARSRDEDAIAIDHLLKNI